MDQRDVVDQWVELDSQIKALIRQREALERSLKTHPAGTELDGRQARVRVRDRAVLQPDKLQEAVTKSMWTRITKRVPVADYYRAEVKRGRLASELLDSCSTRSNKWLEAL